MKWFVLQTQVRREQQVSDTLREKEYRTFLPTLPPDKRKKDKKTQEPVFPGYVFLSMELESDWHTPVRTPGVVNFVKFGDSPAVLENVVIDTLWQEQYLQAASGKVLDYEIGDQVQVKEGVLAMMQGVVQGTQGQRVRVLFDMLSDNSVVELHYDDVEPVKD